MGGVELTNELTRSSRALIQEEIALFQSIQAEIDYFTQSANKWAGAHFFIIRGVPSLYKLRSDFSLCLNPVYKDLIITLIA